MSYLKKHWEKISIIILLLAISFVISMKSGYNVFLRGGVSNYNNYDGDVFRCIGWLMTKGYVPYRDIFDHKGPFLYLIQYIATFFGQVRGIWVFESAFIITSVAICYIFIRKFNKPLISFFVILLMFARWDKCGYGNCTEEFSLLFQVISIYYFVDFFRNQSAWLENFNTPSYANKILELRNRWIDLRVFIIGICFSCTFLMKANLCAVWIVFCLAILFDCVKNKYWHSLKRFLLSFWIGALIIILPILFYLHINSAMADFVRDYFKFNALYSSVIGWVNIKTRVNSFFHFTNNPLWLLAFMTMIYKVRRKDNYFRLDVIYTIFILASALLLAISGNIWPKMEITLIPSFLYPFSILFTMFSGMGKNGNKKLGAVLAGYLIITCIYPGWSNQIIKAAGDINRYVNEPQNIGFRNNDVVLYIKKHTKKDDKISVVGFGSLYYLYSEREPASKYIFLPDPRVNRNIVEEYIKELENSLPKIIVIQRQYKGRNAWVNDKIKVFLQRYDYKLVFNGNKPVYQRK